MTGDYAFYIDTKYDVHYHGVLNRDGLIMVHKQVDGSEFKQTDILHVVCYDAIDPDDVNEERIVVAHELKTNGKVHVSQNKLKRIMSALSELFANYDIHNMNTANSRGDMKALYDMCIGEE